MTTPIHSDGTISITVNGEHRRVRAGLSIAALANELGLVPEKVAVERNLEVVPRSTLAQVCLEDGDDRGPQEFPLDLAARTRRGAGCAVLVHEPFQKMSSVDQSRHRTSSFPIAGRDCSTASRGRAPLCLAVLQRLTGGTGQGALRLIPPA